MTWLPTARMAKKKPMPVPAKRFCERNEHETHTTDKCPKKQERRANAEAGTYRESRSDARTRAWR
jgi:hypothetical protein